MHRIRIWQWPNLLALDTALIAVLWQAAFAHTLDLSISLPAQAVLGLSVWLTYIADRLFDVGKRPLEQLHSTRHHLAKQHFHTLWCIWCGVLIINLAIAFMRLSTAELRYGAMLLACCLLYTLLNQALSRKFFPKEICVAMIYAGGVIVFLLPTPNLLSPLSTLVLLCLINCLMIGAKERRVDAALKVYSMSQLPTRYILLLGIICSLSIGLLSQEWLPLFAPPLMALWLLQFYQKRISVETFRVLTDGALLIGPTMTLFIDF